MIAGDIGVVVDIDSGDTVWVDSGRKLGEGEVTNRNVPIIADIGLDPRTSLADDRPSDVVNSQKAVSTVAEKRRLSGTANLSANNNVERYGVGSDRHQRLLGVCSTLQGDGHGARILGNTVCGVD